LTLRYSLLLSVWVDPSAEHSAPTTGDWARDCLGLHGGGRRSRVACGCPRPTLGLGAAGATRHRAAARPHHYRAWGVVRTVVAPPRRLLRPLCPVGRRGALRRRTPPPLRRRRPLHPLCPVGRRGGPLTSVVVSLLGEGGVPSRGRLWCCFCRVFVHLCV